MRLDWPIARSVSIALAACILLWSASSSPTRADSSLPTTASFLDSDGDGVMSYEEFVRSLATTSMQALDRNGDGFLTQAEVKPQGPEAQSSVHLRFTEVDADGDSRLSAKEVEAGTRKSPRTRILYDTLDVDRDDRVSSSEWQSRSPGLGLLRIQF
jgi:hypothetical protein